MTNPTNKIAIVTGANTGLGYETALELYRQGMDVIIASRNMDKGQDAVERILALVPDAGAKIECAPMNLSSLEGVKAFADWVNSRHNRLDVLVNNAGIMVPPAGLTDDGYESQFGVNFVAHFALTGHLYALLKGTAGARVVTLSSIAHRGEAIDFGNFALQKPYDQWREYGQSKLANLIFALEFDRRLRARASPLLSLAAHPGISQTELTRSVDHVPDDLEFMSAADGAAPTVTAATLPTAQGGQYYGPDGPNETSGKPALASVDASAQDLAINARLWDWAQRATGVHYS